MSKLVRIKLGGPRPTVVRPPFPAVTWTAPERPTTEADQGEQVARPEAEGRAHQGNQRLLAPEYDI